MLAAAGFRFVRMDFGWDATERDKGRYDFSAYDRLLAALEPHKIRAMLILDYSNRHYDQGLSPQSDEGRRAFARWAAAAAKHFRGRGVVWEMYNEPNIGFWRPKPDVQQYVKLALEVGKARCTQAAAGRDLRRPGHVDHRFRASWKSASRRDFWTTGRPSRSILTGRPAPRRSPRNTPGCGS